MDEPVAHCAEGEPTKQLFQTVKNGLPPHSAVLTVTRGTRPRSRFVATSNAKLGKPQNLRFGALLIVVFHRIRIDFEANMWIKMRFMAG